MKSQSITQGRSRWDRVAEQKRHYVLNVWTWHVTFAESLPLSCTFNHKGNSEPGRMRLPGWSFSHTTSPGGLRQSSRLLFTASFLFYSFSLLSLQHLRWRPWCGKIKEANLKFLYQNIHSESFFLRRQWQQQGCWFNRRRHSGLQRRKAQPFLLVNHLTQM